MKQIIKKGSTSKRMAIFISDSSSTTGAGLTGLAYNTSSLEWYYWREDTGNNGGTSVTLATATRGTWTSGGFKEIDATNLPGWYEIGIPDAVLASGAYWSVMMLKGAANMAPCPIEIQLVTYDPTDGNLGLTGLTGLTAPTAGALPTVGSGTNQLVLANGVAQADLRKVLGTAVTESSSGQLAGAYTHFFDVASPTGNVNSLPNAAADTNGGLIIIGTGTRQLNPNAGGIPLSFTGRQQVWDFLFADMTLTSGSIGKLIQDYLNASVSSRAAPGDAMTLTSGERTATANVIEAEIIDDTDSEKVLTAITNKIASVNPDLGGLSVAAIAAAVWNLSRSGHQSSGSFGEFLDAQLSLMKAKTDLIPASPAAVGSAMTLTSAYDAAKTAAQAGDEMGIADGAISEATFTLPTIGSHTLATGPLGMIMQSWRADHYKETLDPATGELKRYGSDGTTVLLVLPCTDTGILQTRGAAS